MRLAVGTRFSVSRTASHPFSFSPSGFVEGAREWSSSREEGGILQCSDGEGWSIVGGGVDEGVMVFNGICDFVFRPDYLKLGELRQLAPEVSGQIYSPYVQVAINR